MIEVQNYRAAERSARFVMASWCLTEMHIVNHFARVGFPVRIQSVDEVGQLFDTVKERRFQRFLTERAALSPGDTDQSPTR